MEKKETINMAEKKAVIGELKEAEEKPTPDIFKRNVAELKWNLDYWIDNLTYDSTMVDSEYLYIRKVDNHIEIGAAQVNFIQ